MAPGKRKRMDRSSIDSGDQRPSPHRPGNTALGQHDRNQDMREGGGRRSSRGGQGGQNGQPQGRGGRRNNPQDRSDTNNRLSVSERVTPTPGPMSSPAPRPPSATQTPTPVIDLPSPIMRPDPMPFDYIFLTDERISAWETTGRQAVVEAGSRARMAEDHTELCTVFQELARTTLDVRIDATEAGNCVKEILGLDSPTAGDDSEAFDSQTLFLDTLSMVVDAEPGASNSNTFPKVLRNFAAATGVSPIMMRQKLDGALIQNLGLTRDTFIRVGIRQATHLLYRQANYNLLREETEGYSKLVAELFTTSESEPPSAEVIADTFEKIKGLIGTFDLDVGRVLDITMDVFAAVLIKHFRFFIKLLRVSSWWPRNGESDGAAAARCNGLPKWALPESVGWFTSEEDEEKLQEQRVKRDIAFWNRAREVGLDAFFELGGREVVDAETRKRLFSTKSDGDAEFDADRQWIETTGTFPPSGNRIAAQLLGFKLRFYSSAARDKEDVLPPNLIYLTALLIKIGFISLKDLYPHLWPLDENMEKVREVRMKELEEKERANRPGGATNALMMAGALVDDTLPNGGRTRETIPTKTDPAAKATADVEDPDKLEEPGDQKVLLLTCLLTIGAIPESLFILGRFPWLPEAYPELLDLIHRILNHSIKDIYDMSRPISSQDFSCPMKEVVDPDQSGVPKGQVRLGQTSPKKLLRWPYPDKHDTNESSSYRFYWDEWADNVPVCQTVDDLFTLCSSLLNYSGVNIGKDASLLSKLARIGVKSLSTDPSKRNLDRWQDLLKRLLVPALSLTKANTSVANEIYDMLRFYPVSIRYLIYAEWFEGQTSRLPAVKAAFARTRLETLGIMKRISMTNLTAMARSLAKTAYASPGVVFAVALSQIEAYTNLTEVVVECAKYFTDLGYDVLVWSLMSSLGGKDRNRNNAEFALLPSRWLLALSRFSGKVFKRYSIMNLSPIIQYVNDQLYRGNSTDLVILKELIGQMAGVVPDTDFTDAQLNAMTGGSLLRKQTLINLQDRRYESTKTAKRLMRALTETKLAGQLLLSIAQHRQAAIYGVSDEDAHIKLLATMIDDSQLILFQYLDLLRSNLSVEDFDSHVPDISDLLVDFGLAPPLAFMIGRASVSYCLAKVVPPTLNGSAETPAILEEPPSTIDEEGDVGMDGVLLPPSGKSISPQLPISTDDDAKGDVAMVEVQEPTPPAIESSDVSIPVEAYDEILQPIIETVQGLYTEESWKAITPQFYVLFWVSTLGDIVFPMESYNVEFKRLSQQVLAIERDRTDMSLPAITRRKESKKAVEQMQKDLKDEWEAEIRAHRKRVNRILERNNMFFMPSIKAEVVKDALLEKCIIPRVLMSPTDADYCFKMIKFLHDKATPNFRTLALYNRLFRTNRLRSIIFACTVREAENFGRFLKSILADLGKWHADSALYERQAWGLKGNLPGFAKALDNEGKPKGLLEHDEKGSPSFKSLLFMWHKAINSALRDCLDGTEWMHIRNAITILKSLVDVFPAVDFMGKGFMKQLETVAKREKDVREDLSLTGNAVLVQLKKRSSHWVMVQAFSSNMTPQAQPNGTSVKPTPPSSTSKSSLKPTAPEFKPQSRASSLGVSTPKPTASEVEDGEVDDAKISSAFAKAEPPTTEVTHPKPASPTRTTVEPQKSDILLKREQHLRERDAKNASASAAGRPELPRNTSSSLMDRNNHALPNRPDAPFPSHRMLDRDRHSSSRYGDRRDGRDARLPDINRLDRPGDKARDFAGNERRDPDPNRDFGRPLDRPRTRPDRPEPPPRWTPDSARENQERAANGGRLSRDVMPPPRPSGPADRGPLPNERISSLNPDRPELINPEGGAINPARAALITGASTPPYSGSPRHFREEPRNARDRISSRPQSPRRHTSDRDHIDSRRDERTNHMDDILPPPVGPRNDRSIDRNHERGSVDRSRDSSAFQSTLPPPRLMDPDHGRLNSNRQQADPNFGRLNSSPNSDVPLGPRDRNERPQRGGRMGNGSQPRRDGRLTTDPPRPPTPEKVVPTGPSANRPPRRSASGQFDVPTHTPGTGHTTPLDASPAHQGSWNFGPAAQQPPPLPTQQASIPPPGVHPDRLRGFMDDSSPSLPPSQLNNSQSRQPFPSIVTAVAPAGPKGALSSPSSAGPNGMAPPTGPASAVERARGGRRQLAGINTMLQQAGQQNAPDRMNVRGRGRLSSAAQAETPLSQPATPTIPPPPPPALGPPPTNYDNGTSDRVDLITGGPPDEERGQERNGRRDRSGRHTHRPSRSPQGSDRNRDAKHGPDDERSGREHRERREGGRPEPSDRDRHQNREQGRDLMASVRDRERDSRRDGRERDGGREMHEAGWTGERGGRSRDMRGGEERRDSRNPRGEDGGRKRRPEEGGMDRGHEKRPRR